MSPSSYAGKSVPSKTGSAQRCTGEDQDTDATKKADSTTKPPLLLILT
jgi:hypothetical protein